MNLSRFIVLGILAAALPVRADQTFATLDVDGQSYNNVTVTLVTASDIYFTYAGGMRNVKLEDLGPALQKHFHYDPDKAKNEEQAQLLASTRYYQSIVNGGAPVNIPAATDSSDANGPLAGLLPGGLIPQIYLDGFFMLGLVFLLTNLACYISGRRSRARQRLEPLSLVDLGDVATRQILSGQRRF